MYSGQNQERIGNGKPQNPRENKPHVIKLRGVKERKKKKKKAPPEPRVTEEKRRRLIARAKRGTRKKRNELTLEARQ